MENIGPVMQTATVIIAIVIGVIHLDRRITRMEERIDPMWKAFNKRRSDAQTSLFRHAND